MIFNGVVEITGSQPLLAPGSRMKNEYIRNQGFILLELLLALALTGLLVSGLMVVYWVSCSFYRFENSQVLMQFTLREARNCMLKDVWGSEDIQILNTRYGGFVGPGAVGSCVKIIVSTVQDMNTDYTGIYYYVQNNRFYRERTQLNDIENDWDDTLVDKIAIADDLVSAVFSSPANGRLDYSLTCQVDSNTCNVNGVGRSRVECSASFGR